VVRKWGTIESSKKEKGGKKNTGGRLGERGLRIADRRRLRPQYAI
jgi:hypothetical protein